MKFFDFLDLFGCGGDREDGRDNRNHPHPESLEIAQANVPPADGGNAAAEESAVAPMLNSNANEQLAVVTRSGNISRLRRYPTVRFEQPSNSAFLPRNNKRINPVANTNNQQLAVLAPVAQPRHVWNLDFLRRLFSPEVPNIINPVAFVRYAPVNPVVIRQLEDAPARNFIPGQRFAPVNTVKIEILADNEERIATEALAENERVAPLEARIDLNEPRLPGRVLPQVNVPARCAFAPVNHVVIEMLPDDEPVAPAPAPAADNPIPAGRAARAGQQYGFFARMFIFASFAMALLATGIQKVTKQDAGLVPSFALNEHNPPITSQFVPQFAPAVVAPNNLLQDQAEVTLAPVIRAANEQTLFVSMYDRYVARMMREASIAQRNVFEQVSAVPQQVLNFDPIARARNLFLEDQAVQAPVNQINDVLNDYVMVEHPNMDNPNVIPPAIDNTQAEDNNYALNALQIAGGLLFAAGGVAAAARAVRPAQQQQGLDIGLAPEQPGEFVAEVAVKQEAAVAAPVANPIPAAPAPKNKKWNGSWDGRKFPGLGH